MESVTVSLEADNPDVRQRHSEEEIRSAIRDVLTSEVADLSAIFRGLYAEFNHRYFQGELSAYRVRIVHAASGSKPRSNLARVDSHRREILIDYDGRPEEMLSLLVDTMGYVAAGFDQEEAWEGELGRLYDLGAPTRQRIEELDSEVEWPGERSRCCLAEDRLEWRREGPAEKLWREACATHSTDSAQLM